MKYLAALVALAVAVGYTGCATAPERIKIDLKQAMGPDNQFTDAAVGLSVKLPTGWTVREASRWGDAHGENTIFLQTARASSAAPSMYYKHYSTDEAGALDTAGAEVLLREGALKKEAARAQTVRGYQNVPESFQFLTINGRPAMAYLATFTANNHLMTEHFVRVLGTKGYVMFFTKGTIADVKALLPELMQAVATVKWP